MCVSLSAELPGAPSNLVISNISPRSATLQFRPGYDGKTSICKWIVEGQVWPWQRALIESNKDHHKQLIHQSLVHLF